MIYTGAYETLLVELALAISHPVLDLDQRIEWTKKSPLLFHFIQQQQGLVSVLDIIALYKLEILTNSKKHRTPRFAIFVKIEIDSYEFSPPFFCIFSHFFTFFH